MATSPNILFLMTDQMRGDVLEPDHVCRTPNFDRLAARGVRIANAYTPNPVSSPARASLMTGLLPHEHGVLTVDHCVDDDQGILRTDKPHWAQRLAEAGYRNGYFGKWHVERSNDLTRFGWHTDGGGRGAMFVDATRTRNEGKPEPEIDWLYTIDTPAGYDAQGFCGITDVEPDRRMMGVTTHLAIEFLRDAMTGDAPWCCFASVIEPHDPFVCGRDAYDQYDGVDIPLPASLHDEMADRPGLYRKGARAYAPMRDDVHREAARCYFAMVTEVDQQFGRLIDAVEQAGQLDNTIIVLTSDHGENLGAHGMYLKNVGAWEETYRIPIVVAGPDIATGQTTSARVGLHELCPTLLDLAGAAPIDLAHGRSFAPLLRDPVQQADQFTTGYAEYFGTRYWFSQRVIWDGRWKLVWNGFDFDELYDLERDPHEMHNRMHDPACADHVKRLMQQAWRIVRDTDDRSLLNSQYAALRLAPYGPGVLDDE